MLILFDMQTSRRVGVNNPNHFSFIFYTFHENHLSVTAFVTHFGRAIDMKNKLWIPEKVAKMSGEFLCVWANKKRKHPDVISFL